MSSTTTNEENEEWTITLVYPESGHSESIPVLGSTNVAEVETLARALFGVNDDAAMQLTNDNGKVLTGGGTLQSVGVRNGHVLAFGKLVVRRQQQQRSSSSAAAPTTTRGGLDFTSLLASAGNQQPPQAAAAATTIGGLDFTSLLASAGNQQPPLAPPEPVYYTGMNLHECMQYNTHPHPFITLLQTKEHLFKELNYHNAALAAKLKNKHFKQAVSIWREELVKGGIQAAMQASTQYHTEQSMTQRRANNPDDEQAREYFDKQTKKRNAQEQYQHMTSEYPEALGRVLMLYVSAKINGHDVQPFVDSGAQSTIISLKLARACGLENYIDERFAGTAVGVGTGTILGRIHMVQLQIETMFFPCSVSVMDDSLGGSEMPFLLGLDMLKRHTCQIDLEQGCLKFRVAPGQYMVTPFLHEKDLDETKGGTKGFNADESNKKLAAAIEKAEKDGDRDDGNDDMDTLS